MKTNSLFTLAFALLTATFVGAQGVMPPVPGGTGTPSVPTYLFYYATSQEEASGTVYPVISYEAASAVEASAYLPVKERASYTSSATLAENEILRFLVVSTSTPLDTVSASDWDGNSQTAPKIPVSIQANGEPIALDWVTEAGITLKTSWVSVNAKDFVTIKADGMWSNAAATNVPGLSNASIAVSQSLDSSMTHYLFLVAYDTRDAEGKCAGVVDEDVTVNAYGIAYVDTFTVGGSSPIGIKQYGYLISNDATPATVGNLNPVRPVYTEEAMVMKAPTKAQITFGENALVYANGTPITEIDAINYFRVRVAQDTDWDDVTYSMTTLRSGSFGNVRVVDRCMETGYDGETWDIELDLLDYQFRYDETTKDALFVCIDDTRDMNGNVGFIPQAYAYVKLCDIEWKLLPESEEPEVLQTSFDGPLVTTTPTETVTFAEAQAILGMTGQSITEADVKPTFTATEDGLTLIPDVVANGIGLLYALQTKTKLSDVWQDANEWLKSVNLPETATEAEKDALEDLKAKDYTRIPADGKTPLTLPKIAGESSRFYRLVCPAIDSETSTP